MQVAAWHILISVSTYNSMIGLSDRRILWGGGAILIGKEKWATWLAVTAFGTEKGITGGKCSFSCSLDHRHSVEMAQRGRRHWLGFF